MEKLSAALKSIAVMLLALSVIAGCSTGGLTDSSGGGTTGDGTNTDGSTAPAAAPSAGFVNLLTSSPQVGSDGLSTVTLTAIVKTAKNVALKDKAVIFESSSVAGSLAGGTLVVTRGTTDATGTATATLSAAADKSKRMITVTATADSITSTTLVDVVGTTLQITGQNSLVSGTSAKLSLFFKDSAGATIPNQAITLASRLGNSISPNPVSTNANGQADVTYTATFGGADSVTASALGATATQDISVSTTDFIFTAPSSDTEINIGTTQTVTIHYALSGVPQPGKTVNFSTTRGTILPLSAVTDGSGNASANLSSSTAGPAIISATMAVAGTTIQVPVEFIAITASSLSLQAYPSTISTNTAGSAVEQSTIIAVIRDSAGNLVKNKTVRFSLTDVTGGYIKQASDTTNSQGMASTTYISGISPSVKNGVTINASVDGLSSLPAYITVASKPIYVVFGTGNTIENYSATQYRVPFVALVTDIAGNPQAGITVTANLTPVTYLKGSYTGCPGPTHWTWSPAINNGTYLECINEDNNPIFYGSHPDWALNGVLNSGGGQTEDINGDGLLTPGNVAEVNRTATTDANGFAQFYVVYAKQFANWVKVRIEGRIYSYGDQTLGTTQFYLPVLRDDVACAVSPPGGISPFGLGASPNNVCTNVPTASSATAPTAVTATTLSPSQIQVSWAAATGAVAYRIYQGGIAIRDSVALSIVISNLSANATYCYAVASLDAANVESSKSSTVCATTELAVPDAPTLLTATAFSSVQIDLAWTAPVGGARGYNIYRSRLNSLGDYVGWVMLGSVPATTVSDKAGAWTYPAGELAPTTHVQYCYRITAWNEPGSDESTSTAAVCVATP